MTKARHIPFRHGILENSWLKWFKVRNPHLVLKQLQELDSNRARALCLSNVERFNANLSFLYTIHKYKFKIICNSDESGVQANRNGLTGVFASRRTKNVQMVVPNEREHITTLTMISAIGENISNIFK